MWSAGIIVYTAVVIVTNVQIGTICFFFFFFFFFFFQYIYIFGFILVNLYCYCRLLCFGYVTALEMASWTWVHHFSVYGSIFVYFTCMASECF